METVSSCVNETRAILQEVEAVFIKTEEPGSDDEVTYDIAEVKQESSYNADQNKISETNYQAVEIVKSQFYQCNEMESTSNHKTDNIKHACIECNKEFSKASGLKKHKSSRSCNKVYKCVQCDKEYSHARGLRVHLITHRAIKPYKCNECEMACRTLGALKSHLLVHAPKAFKCMQCDKKFTRNDALRTHMVTHIDT